MAVDMVFSLSLSSRLSSIFPVAEKRSERPSRINGHVNHVQDWVEAHPKTNGYGSSTLDIHQCLRAFETKEETLPSKILMRDQAVKG